MTGPATGTRAAGVTHAVLGVRTVADGGANLTLADPCADTDEQADLLVLVVPNAGMPENVNGKAIYKLSPSDMASEMKEFITNYEFVRIVGGCCGTSPAHILELRHTIDEKK